MNKFYLPILLAVFCTPVTATSINPLDDGGWSLVAHMSNTGGMFDGNGELAPNYSYGSFVENPTASTADFQRAFPFEASKILFITGDQSIWGITDYSTLRSLIDARSGDFAPNIDFEMGFNGTITNTVGNVLSRPNSEDPWISLSGDHYYGINNNLMLWGENNWNGGTHTNLKNLHGGLNVYIQSTTVPVPAAAWLFISGLIGLIGVSRRKA